METGHTEKGLPEQVIMVWNISMTCRPQSKNRGITHIRVSFRYLMALGIPVFEPDYIKEHPDFVPYAFSDEGFQRIVHVADGFQRNKRDSTRSSYVFPMLLRILYGCGLSF